MPPARHKQRAQHDQTGDTHIEAADKPGSAADPAAALTTAQLQALIPGLRYRPVVRHKLQQGSALYREAMRQVRMRIFRLMHRTALTSPLSSMTTSCMHAAVGSTYRTLTGLAHKQDPEGGAQPTCSPAPCHIYCTYHLMYLHPRMQVDTQWQAPKPAPAPAASPALAAATAAADVYLVTERAEVDWRQVALSPQARVEAEALLTYHQDMLVPVQDRLTVVAVQDAGEGLHGPVWTCPGTDRLPNCWGQIRSSCLELRVRSAAVLPSCAQPVRACATAADQQELAAGLVAPSSACTASSCYVHCFPQPPSAPAPVPLAAGGLIVKFVHVPAPLSPDRAAALMTFVWALGSGGCAVPRIAQGDASASVGRHNIPLVGPHAALLRRLQDGNALPRPEQELTLWVAAVVMGVCE